MRDTSHKLNGRKWITALLVSPGMLFLFAYLSLFLSLQAYLNRAVKSYLSSQSFSSETGTCRATIGSLDVDFWLTSLTIRNLRMSTTPIGAKADVSSPSISREQFFPAVKISGNWMDRLISLRTASLDKIVVHFSSNEQPHRLLDPAFTANTTFDAGLTSVSTTRTGLNGDIVQNDFINTQNPSPSHERLNSLFVEVLTLLSRQKL
ncbi:MAG: hypothetical protein HGB19_05815 [Chlorobiales bacterium]|jgi:hypothetical protein|nr:hypothetical protein [Chlorobiales bacterium]